MTPTDATKRRWSKTFPALAVAVLLSTLFVSSCDDVKVSADDYVAQAQEYRNKGDLKASIIEAKNALRIDPEKQEARFILGRDYLDLGVWNFAEAMLEKAYKQKGVLEYAIMPELAEAKLQLGKYDEVLDIAQVHDIMTAALKARILVARGRAYSGKLKSDEADKLFHKAIKIDPKSYQAYLGLAGLAIAGGEEDKGEALLAKAVEIAPEETAVHQFKARNFYRKKEYEKSAQEYQTLVRAHPTRFDFRLGLASALVAAGKDKEAIALLDKLLKRAPKEPYANYLRALAAFHTKDYEAAYLFSSKTLSVVKDHPPSLLIAGASAFVGKQYEQAAQYLRHYVQLRPKVTDARILLGELQLQMKRGKEALATLEVAAKDQPKNVALLQKIALAATMTGDVQKGGDYFQKAAELAPQDAHLQAALGISKIAMGDTKAGIAELERAVQVDPNLPKAEISLILQLLKENRFDEALKAAQRLQERHPDRAAAYTIAGLTYFAMGRAKEAKESFRKALKVNPKAADAASNLAELEIRSGNPEKGRELLEGVLRNYPRHFRVLLKLGELEMRLGNPEKSLALLEKASDVHPDAYQPKLLMAQVLMFTGRFDKALVVAQSVPARYRQEAAILEVLGQAQMATRRVRDARDTFQDLVKVKPKSGYARYLLATAYIGMADLGKGEAELHQALALDPKDLRAKNTLADVQLRRNRINEAAKTIDELEKQSKNRLQNLVLKGRLALRRGKWHDAVETLTEATKIGRGTDLTLYLAVAYAQDGNPAKAAETMQSWLKKHPDDIKVRFRLASFHLARNDIDDAKREFADLVSRQPRNWIFLNNLADILNRQGHFTEARPHAEKAYEMAPSIPAVLDTYGVTLLGLSEIDRAVKILRSANDGAPKSMGIAYDLARALAKKGQVDEARSMLKNLLSNKAPFGARREAENLLKSLGG